MRRKAIVMAVISVLALAGGAASVLAADWWEEEQTNLVQTREGKDAEGNPYKVVANWEDGYVEATGMGTADPRTAVNDAQALAMAEDAARVRAYGQLAEEVLGFNITSDITVVNGLAEKSEQRLRLEGFLKGARVIEKQSEWLPDGSPMVTVRVGIVLNRKHPGISAPSPAPPKPVERPTPPPPVVEQPVSPPPVTPPPVAAEKPRTLSEVLAVTIRETEEVSRKERQIEVYIPAPDAPLPTGMGMELEPRAIVRPVPEQPVAPPPVAPEKPVEKPATVPTVAVFEFPDGTQEKDYTGLIVDARGLDGSPSLSPKVFSQYGKEVWGTLEVDPDWAFNYGVADFAHDPDIAKGKERAGPTPLVVTAIRVEGARPDSALKSDFVVSELAANLILKMNDRAKSKDKDGKGFLEKCAVVFIL